MGKKERLKYPDIAKGLGIIAVLCAHAGVGIIWIQPYYMPMFFAVSGCIFRFLCNHTGNCFESARKMATYYFKYSIIVALLYIPLFFIKQNDCSFLVRNIIGVFYARKAVYSPLELESNIIFMELGNGPMWFLPCLAVAWILFIPLNYCKKRPFIAAIIVLYLICSDVLGRMKIMLPWSVDTAFVAAIFIFFGTKFEIIRQKYLVNSAGDKIKYFAIAFGLCLMGYHIVITKVSIRWNMSVGTYATSISSGVYFFCLFCMWGTAMLLLMCCLIEELPVVNLFSTIGKKSLPILCFHAVLYQYIEVVNEKLHLSQYSWYIALKILVAVVVSVFLDKLMCMIEHKWIGN